MRIPIARTRLTRSTIAFVAALASLLLLNVGTSSATTSSSYPTIVFSDGFESGSLSAWDGTGGGNGAVSVTAAAAHSGTHGAQIVNAAGQLNLIVKTLPNPLPDSAVSFWAYVATGAGFQTLAQARDASSSQNMWTVLYDSSNKALWFYPYNSAGASTEIFTGANSVPLNTWVQITVQYSATATGGAQLYINGQTNSAWGVSGNYTRASNLQRLQLWNDAADTTYFDDVTVATPAAGAPTAPGAPTGVQGTSGDKSVALNWTAPSSDGGSPITGYKVTPFVNGSAQTPILTNSTSTNYTVTGLTNGAAYTFTVAAINAVGTGSASSPSPSITPAPPSAPGAPTGAQGTPGDGAVNLSWTAPASNGGSPITGYRITPRINGVAQTPTVTGGTATTQYVGGLTNGTAYTFTVAAINAVGTGPDSSASASVTPAAGQTSYSNVVFSDGFESGSLSAWDGTGGGNGAVSVTAAGAHTGSFGARIANASGQSNLVVKTLAKPLTDSSISFWARIGSGGGFQTRRTGSRSVRRRDDVVAVVRRGTSGPLLLSLQQRWRLDRALHGCKLGPGQHLGTDHRAVHRHRDRGGAGATSMGRRTAPGASAATTAKPQTSSACSCGTMRPIRRRSTTSPSPPCPRRCRRRRPPCRQRHETAGPP